MQIEAGNPAQTQVHHLDQAHEMVDDCMASALRQRKPVYLNVCCNLAGAPLPRPPLLPPPIPLRSMPLAGGTSAAVPVPPPPLAWHGCRPHVRTLLPVTAP